MKTIPPPSALSVVNSIDTIQPFSPRAPHVKLASPTTPKRKKRRKDTTKATKTKRKHKDKKESKTDSPAVIADSILSVESTVLSSRVVPAQAKKPSGDKRSYVTWPRHIKRNQSGRNSNSKSNDDFLNIDNDTYVNVDVVPDDDLDNDTPFHNDELATLEEFDAISRKRNSNSAKNTKEHNTKANIPKRPPRRRQIDPSTCERDYSKEEIEFMNALNEYKRSSGRMFPTCSEILEVLKNLGYERSSTIVST
ncbi:MAG: hypothetical protein LBQ66_14650 [Planctomycetaceae bacterium]|jgi:hypothetical protein|nr:hypothetical protein [Planctomycetaceae bacterium]